MSVAGGMAYTLVITCLLVIGAMFPAQHIEPNAPKANTQEADQAHMWHQRWIAMKHKARLRGEKPKAKWMRGWIATWYAQGGTTASGKPTVQGTTIAVDPRVIPLGSKVEVKYPDGSTHDYTAEDTGGLVKGDHIDVFDPSVSECLVNGRKEVQVRIIDKAR